MREDIGLFRGKRLDNGEWVEGYLYCAFSLDSEGDEQTDYYILRFPRSAFGNNITAEAFPVDPATIGEYCGLQDKNGKRVFEGDILGSVFNGKIRKEGVVEYGTFNCSCCDGVYGWYLDYGDIRSLNYSMFETPLFVIGNIHDVGGVADAR